MKQKKNPTSFFFKTSKYQNKKKPTTSFFFKTSKYQNKNIGIKVSGHK